MTTCNIFSFDIDMPFLHLDEFDKIDGLVLTNEYI
jgi:hypothetical protein